jgi:hypothetical protein
MSSRFFPIQPPSEVSKAARLAFTRQLVPRAASFRRGYLRIERRPVVHTRHPTWGYPIVWGDKRVAWAPEFFRFPGGRSGSEVVSADTWILWP